MIEKLIRIILIIILINYIYNLFFYKKKKIENLENSVNYSKDCLKIYETCDLDNEEILYKKFLGKENENDEKTGWDKIFEHAPRPKRNSAGPIFFNWIITKMNPTIKEFEAYNRFYCGVSGSVVRPCSNPDLVKIKETNTSNTICGYYYRCC